MKQTKKRKDAAQISKEDKALLQTVIDKTGDGTKLGEREDNNRLFWSNIFFMSSILIPVLILFEFIPRCFRYVFGCASCKPEHWTELVAKTTILISCSIFSLLFSTWIRDTGERLTFPPSSPGAYKTMGSSSRAIEKATDRLATSVEKVLSAIPWRSFRAKQ